MGWKELISPFERTERVYPQKQGMLLANSLVEDALDIQMAYLIKKMGRVPASFRSSGLSDKLKFATSFTIPEIRFVEPLAKINANPDQVERLKQVTWTDLVHLFAGYCEWDLRFAQSILGSYPKENIIVHREGDTKVHPKESKIHYHEGILKFIFAATGIVGNLQDPRVPQLISDLRDDVNEEYEGRRKAKKVLITRLINGLLGRSKTVLDKE